MSHWILLLRPVAAAAAAARGRVQQQQQQQQQQQALSAENTTIFFHFHLIKNEYMNVDESIFWTGNTASISLSVCASTKSPPFSASILDHSAYFPARAWSF